MFTMGKKSQLIIESAEKQYEDSIQIFHDAKNKIAKANASLVQTIEEIDQKVKELQELKARAERDKIRNEKMNQKLEDFLTVE